MAKTSEKRECPPRQVLQDGTEVRLVPLEKTKGRPLYVSRDGVPYSFATGKLVQITPVQNTTPSSKTNGCRKQRYLVLQNHNGIKLHHAVALAWIGPRPEGCECDHLNGIVADNRADNLEWVTPAENRCRALILRQLRKTMNVAELSREELRRLLEIEPVNSNH